MLCAPPSPTFPPTGTSGQTGAMRYLSLDWIDAVAAGIAERPEVAAAAAGVTAGITQVVTDGPEGTVIYHLQIEDGSVGFGSGPADPENVRFEQTWETAVAVATNQMNAQEAFIGGRILLTGDQAALMSAQPVFGALDAVFSDVRQNTEYDEG